MSIAQRFVMIGRCVMTRVTGRLVIIGVTQVAAVIYCFLLANGCAPSSQPADTPLRTGKEVSPDGPLSETAVQQSPAEAQNTAGDTTGNQPTVEKQIRFDFEDVAKSSNVVFVPRNGFEARQMTMLETLGTGVAAVDFDLDGLPDIFLPGGGLIRQREILSHPPAFFRNLGNFQFENCTAIAAIQTGKSYSNGIVVGDHDNDGFPDIIVTGYTGVQFLRNQGDGTFLEQSPAGMDETLWSTGGALGDLNSDGHPDLFVAHYLDWSWSNHPACGTPSFPNVCPPRRLDSLPDSLYLNQGDGTWLDVSESVKLKKGGRGLGVLMCDLDQDTDLDIYVGNDTDYNYMYYNDGAGGLQDMAVNAGTAWDEDGGGNGSMGIDICDYNQDGLFDLWVTNFEHESFALYRNEDNHFFLHASLTSGISRLGPYYVGWGTAWHDFDLDGDEDFIASNGHILYNRKGNPIPQPPILMENVDARFANVGRQASAYFQSAHLGRGLATADFDRDGDIDIIAAHLNTPVALLKNSVSRQGSWLEVRAIGRQSPRMPIGTIMELQTASGSMIRQVKAGGSYLSQSEQALHWGVPEGDTIERLVIKWPSGASQEIKDVKLNSLTTVVEPRSN